MKRSALLLAVLLLAAPSVQAQVPDLNASYPWPEHDEVMAALDQAAASDWVTLHVIGTAVSGKPLVVAEITDPDSAIPLAERVHTYILTQQHGNEPAGTPAALALLDDIVAGEPIRDTLHNQVLLLWPLANPDGGSSFTRGNQNGTDLNRDHIHLHEPESQALHTVLHRWDVHVGMDHHEYSGTGLGYPVPVRLYDFDATTLFPRHGNVREPTQAWAENLMYDGIWPPVEQAGYSINEYGVQTVAGIPVGHVAGGPDPGILRNNMGLQNVAGLLVETFVPLAAPNPFIDAQRRIDVHRVIMDATLEYASANAVAFIEAKRESERLNLEAVLSEYVEMWPDDPVTGEANAGNVHAALADAYLVRDSLDAVMARHALPSGLPDADGHIYLLQHERQGLLAAMLNPESSRSLAPDAIAVEDAPERPGSEFGEPAERSTPVLTPLLVLVLLGLVAVLRRR